MSPTQIENMAEAYQDYDQAQRIAQNHDDMQNFFGAPGGEYMGNEHDFDTLVGSPAHGPDTQILPTYLPKTEIMDLSSIPTTQEIPVVGQQAAKFFKPITPVTPAAEQLSTIPAPRPEVVPMQQELDHVPSAGRHRETLRNRIVSKFLGGIAVSGVVGAVLSNGYNIHEGGGTTWGMAGNIALAAGIGASTYRKMRSDTSASK